MPLSRLTFNPFGTDSPPPILRPLEPLPSQETRRPTHHPDLLYEGPTRKRPRQLSGAQADSVACWGYNPTIGIVHQDDGICTVCDLYVDHITAATRRNEASFQQAVSERDKKWDMYFFDGFAEGRRRQKDDDLYLRQELHAITEALDEEKKGYQKLQEELAQVKLQLFNSEEQLKQLKNDSFSNGQNTIPGACSHPSPPTSEPTHGSSVGSFMELTQSLLSRKLECAPTVLTWPPPVKAEPQEAHILHIPTPPNEKEHQANRAVRRFSPTETRTMPSDTYASVASTFTPDAAPYSFSNLPPRPSQPLPALKFASNDLRATAARNLGPQARHPRTLEELKCLMDQAHEPGNEAALTQVKALCAKAHLTPRERKTAMQRYLLANWRNPSTTPPFRQSPATACSSTPSTLLPVVKTNPRMDDPVEVWYDYLCVHPQSWPRGVRRDHRNRPYMSDLRASRAVARMRPELLSLRTEFITCVTDLFSSLGMYRRLLEEHNMRVSAMISFKPFPGQSPVTLDAIARHFADCGVTISDATKDFEPWARCHRESSIAQAFTSSSAVSTFHS